MKKWLSSVAIFMLLPSQTLAMTAYDTVEQNATLLGPILQQQTGDIQDDTVEAELSAKPDFFPDDGRATEETPTEDPNLLKFVSVRIAGVPYALKDVPIGEWFAPYVRDMAERGIVSGYKDANGIPTGVFAPAKGVTIEELAKMAIEAAHIDTSTCPVTPKNTAALQSWSAPYIACAEAKGLILFADGTVDIRRPATRAEVLVTVLQAFGIDMPELLPNEKLFTDVSPSTLFAPAIKTAVKDGIVTGYADADGRLTGEFKPSNPINRAEVCKILSIALQVY